MTNIKTKVIIADDHIMLTDGIEGIIAKMQGFEVIAKVHSGKMLLQYLNSLTPDIILLDIEMPSLNGMQAAVTIRKNNPFIKIILLSHEYNKQTMAFINEWNIEGFISKSASAPALIEGLKNVMEGVKVMITPQSSEPVIYEGDEDDKILKQYKITKIEREIIILISKGYSTKMIADARKKSHFTIDTQRSNIFKKLAVNNVAELISFCTLNGLI